MSGHLLACRVVYPCELLEPGESLPPGVPGDLGVWVCAGGCPRAEETRLWALRRSRVMTRPTIPKIDALARVVARERGVVSDG